MNKSEWNNFFGWMAALFPQWHPDGATSAAWYNEIGRNDPETLRASVRAINSRKPSPFPPGVFEIASEARDPGQASVEIEAARAWEKVRLCARGTLAIAKATSNDSALSEAIRLVGGLDEIGVCPAEKRPFLERRFVEIYCGLKRGENAKDAVARLRAPMPSKIEYVGPEKVSDLMPRLTKRES